MIVLSVCSLITALLSLSIGHYVLYCGPKNFLTVLFFLVCVCMFLWGGLDFGFRQASSYATASIWLRFCLLWPMAVSIGLHFVAAFTQQGGVLSKRWLYFLIYFPAILFSTCFLILSPENGKLVMAAWGWTIHLPEDNAVHVLSVVWGVVVSVVSIIMCVRYYFNSSGLRVKQSALIFLLCMTIISISGVMTAFFVLLPGLDFPQLVTVGLLITCIIAGMAIWKNGFFVLTPMTNANDITGNLQSMAGLKEQEDKFRGIAERSFDLIFMVDNSGHLTYVSPALETLFLYRPEDVLGQPFAKFVVADDTRKMLEIYDRFNHGEDIGTQRVTLLKKDGSHAFVEFNLSRIYKDGEHIGTQGIVRDATDRKKYEKALKESKEKYKLIFENVNDAIVFLDSAGTIIEVNRKTKEIFGLGQEELGGKDFREFSHLFPHEEFGKVMRIFDNMFAEASNPSEVIHVVRSDGSKVIVEVNARLVLKGSDIKGLLIVVREITKRVNAEEENKKLGVQLFRAQKMEALGTMASGVAHDFNNSLGTMILNAGVALEETSPKGEVRHYLEQILKTGKSSKKLVHQILTFSRDKEVVRKPMNIAVIVKETLEMLKSMLPSSTEIHEKIDPHVLPVMADATQIQQLVMNLCSNGSQAMKDKGGTLIVSLENVHFDRPCPDVLLGASVGPGRFVKLTVKDNGHGIAPEIRDRVFDPFFTTKKQGEGTGLGLSVVHGVVASHEGSVAIYSEPGRGTSFMIYFPTVENEAVKAMGKNGPMPCGKESILFVDDEPDFINISKRMLSRLGYQVQGATSARQALDIFKSRDREFDIVITDLTMPHMTGIEFSRELIQIRPDIPIILSTGVTGALDHEEIKKTGIRGYIIKPFVVREIAETLRRVLDESAN